MDTTKQLNLSLSKSKQYLNLFSKINPAWIDEEYLKDNPKFQDKSLIRIYKKYEKINFQLKEVYYFVVYKSTEANFENIILYKRTTSLKEINRIKKHLNTLK